MYCKKGRTISQQTTSKGTVLYCKACKKTFPQNTPEAFMMPIESSICLGCTKRKTTDYDRRIAQEGTRKELAKKSTRSHETPGYPGYLDHLGV